MDPKDESIAETLEELGKNSLGGGTPQLMNQNS